MMYYLSIMLHLESQHHSNFKPQYFVAAEFDIYGIAVFEIEVVDDEKFLERGEDN